MKWLKVSLLFVLTLAAMRLCSWSLKLVLTKLMPGRRKLNAVLANGACLVAFISWLYYDLLPGEPIDLAAVIFGVVVFGIFGYWDARTRPMTINHQES